MEEGLRRESQVEPGEGPESDFLDRRRQASADAVRKFAREQESKRRLDAAYQEMAPALYGEGEQVTEEGAAKTFQCEQCGRKFSSQPAFAGHVGGHKRAGSSRRGKPGGRAPRQGAEPRFKCRHCGEGFEALHEISAHVRGAHGGLGPHRGASSGSEQIPCPMCARPLPPGAALVTKEFIREGVDEERAARLAAIAYGLLHVPGRPS